MAGHSDSDNDDVDMSSDASDNDSCPMHMQDHGIGATNAMLGDGYETLGNVSQELLRSVQANAIAMASFALNAVNHLVSNLSKLPQKADSGNKAITTEPDSNTILLNQTSQFISRYLDPKFRDGLTNVGQAELRFLQLLQRCLFLVRQQIYHAQHQFSDRYIANNVVAYYTPGTLMSNGQAAGKVTRRMGGEVLDNDTRENVVNLSASFFSAILSKYRDSLVEHPEAFGQTSE